MRLGIHHSDGVVSLVCVLNRWATVRIGLVKFWRPGVWSRVHLRLLAQVGTYWRPPGWLDQMPWDWYPYGVARGHNFQGTQLVAWLVGIEWCTLVRDIDAPKQIHFYKRALSIRLALALLACPGVASAGGSQPAELAFRHVPDFHPAVFMAVMLCFLFMMFLLTLGGGSGGNRRR